MKLQFIGCGDAFGSGGRFNTCFHITDRGVNFLLDCGASSLISLKTHTVALNNITLILVTHFHADHFGGIPFFLLNAQLVSRRTQPLIIAGPHGLRERFERVMEAFFPGSSNIPFRFDLTLIELQPGTTTAFGELQVTPFAVNHGNPGGPFFAYRIKAHNRIISYTGDTEWTDELIAVGNNADVFIAEAYFFDKNIKLHLNYANLIEHVPLINARRLVLTHMSDDMLSNLSKISYEVAEDGKVVEI